MTDWTPRYRSGFRGMRWDEPPLSDILADAGLTVTCYTWVPPIDAFDPSAPWWQWRTPCDCPDTNFGRNPHRWNCDLTPVWAQTIRALNVNPWTVVRPRDLAVVDIRIRSRFCDLCSCCFPWSPCRPDCHVCWTQPHREDRP